MQPADECNANSSNTASVLQSNPPEMYPNMYVIGKHSVLIKAVLFPHKVNVSLRRKVVIPPSWLSLVSLVSYKPRRHCLSTRLWLFPNSSMYQRRPTDQTEWLEKDNFFKEILVSFSISLYKIRT